MKREICDFIKDNRIATISCIDNNNKPYSFHCFYVFDEKNAFLFFKSSLNTYHSKALANNPFVSGSILPDKIDMLHLKGIQFTGVIAAELPDGLNAELYYHKKLPFAIARPGHVWYIQIDIIKMTDNSKVFGNKLHWERPAWYNYSPS